MKTTALFTKRSLFFLYYLLNLGSTQAFRCIRFRCCLCPSLGYTWSVLRQNKSTGEYWDTLISVLSKIRKLLAIKPALSLLCYITCELFPFSRTAMEHCQENCDVAQNCRSGIINCLCWSHLVKMSHFGHQTLRLKLQWGQYRVTMAFPGFNLLFFLLNNDFYVFHNYCVFIHTF